MNLQEELVRADEQRQRRFSRQISLTALQEILQKEGESEQAALRKMGLSENAISAEQQNWITQCRLNARYAGGIYHVDDLQKICMDYRMRMLPSHLYRGPIDPLFGVKVKHFEQEQQLSARQLEDNFYIVAPAEAFQLEERQRPVENIDPLLLYKVDDQHYKLVHQWGADLHIFRYVWAWRHRSLLHMTCHWMLMTFMFTLMLLGFFLQDISNAAIVASLVSGLIGWMHFSSLHDRADELTHQFSKYNWNQTWTY